MESFGPLFLKGGFMRLVLIVLLILLLIGVLPAWPHAGFGLSYWPSGILGLLLIVLLVMAVLGPRGDVP